MILNSLEHKKIENVVIFVCDSLRWDYAPTPILDMGKSVKTVAASLYTASSFPCIVSGLYPPKTGVHSWEDLLPIELRGLLNFDGYNSSLWCETTWTNLPPDKSAIHMILGYPKGISLEEIEPPFVYIEDDKGGHCPYGFSFGGGKWKKFSEFYKEYGKKGKAELVKQYNIGIRKSVEVFKKRIKTLEDRNLIDNTLVIFTSDHGELLGEYGGLTGHGRPACPELVYVPTVFIHPSLKPEKMINSIISHVDFYPTILGILNKKSYYDSDGFNLLNDSSSSIALNFRSGSYFKSKSKIRNWINYESSGAWDYNGGHIFHGLNFIKALSIFSIKIFLQKHVEFNFMFENIKSNSKNKAKDYINALKHLTIPHIKYMNPKLTKENAKNIIKTYMGEKLKVNEKIIVRNRIQKLKLDGKI